MRDGFGVKSNNSQIIQILFGMLYLPTILALINCFAYVQHMIYRLTD